MSWASFIRRRSVASLIRGSLRYLFGRRGQRRVRGLRLFYGVRMSMVLASAEPIAKLARGEDVRIWVDGQEAFDRLERLIRHARHSIVIQMFIWRDDATGRRIASVLLEAARRGV